VREASAQDLVIPGGFVLLKVTARDPRVEGSVQVSKDHVPMLITFLAQLELNPNTRGRRRYRYVNV
jgi:hypothetical protein